MNTERKGIVLVHGGAGVILTSRMTTELENEYHCGIREALTSGLSVLESGGSSLDSVIEAVKSLEDNPLFNAGRGSVFTTAETLEMEAAVMDGKTKRTGAITSLWGPRHPIEAARAVMENTKHVFLSGPGASAFCRSQGLEHCDPSWFVSPRRLEALRSLLHPPTPSLGTVGAVAIDSQGHLSAATSTGGRTGKLPGRIGDTPIIGAGTWADSETCAVSCTGTGEFFIRTQAAHEVHLRMRWGRQSLVEACHGVVFDELVNIGGDGGLIAIDSHGNFQLLFNSEGMYRGYVTAGDRVLHTAICKEEYRTQSLS